MRVRWVRVIAIVLVVAGVLLVAPGLARGDGPDRPAPRVTYVVESGDTLWSIAQDQLAKAKASGGAEEPTDSEVADYWAKLKKANQDRLRDPDLIFPGEEIILPPVD